MEPHRKQPPESKGEYEMTRTITVNAVVRKNLNDLYMLE